MGIASVHVADVGVRSVPTVLRRAPRAGALPGLRSGHVANAAPLRTGRFPVPRVGRVIYVAFWDDDAALDAFEKSHPVAPLLTSGWSARLEPVRAHGAWPGLDASVPPGRSVEYDGPTVVLTLAKAKWTRLVPFLKTSTAAEHSALAADGLLWATAAAMPPFFTTCSLWPDCKSLMTYAYGRSEPAHANAIAAGDAKPFHNEQAFIRFRPYAVQGSLSGKNPLPAECLSVD